MRNGIIKRKRIIIFGFEGKNNKTESNYFSHFKPRDDSFLLRCISCGNTDPLGMISSIKQKWKDYDYNAKEDVTYLFIDCDCDENKSKYIDELQSKQKKDLIIIKTNPCFELWFLNHFKCANKEYINSKELIKELMNYLPNYSKEKDYYSFLENNTDKAIANSKNQLKNSSKSFTEVCNIIRTLIIPK